MIQKTTDPEIFVDPIDEIINQYGYPPVLAKACVDPFSYAAKLRDGTTVEFSHAMTINRIWIHLELDEPPQADMPCERGIDIRLDAIVWVADAPQGT